jgi:hypothetical protein
MYVNVLFTLDTYGGLTLPVEPNPTLFVQYLTSTGCFLHGWRKLSDFLFGVWPSEEMRDDGFVNTDNGSAVPQGRAEAGFHRRCQTC